MTRRERSRTAHTPIFFERGDVVDSSNASTYMDFRMRVYKHFLRKDITAVIYDDRCVAHGCDKLKYPGGVADDYGIEHFVCAEHRWRLTNLRMPTHVIIGDSKWSPINVSWRLSFPDDAWPVGIMHRFSLSVNYYHDEMEQIRRNRALIDDIVRHDCKYTIVPEVAANPSFSPAHGAAAAVILVGLSLLIRRARRITR